MFRKIFQNGSQLLVKRQTTILSAATIIMVMIALARVLGLVRNRILAHYFSVEVLSVYFAAFRLPEVVFEVLVFGALSSAFIPVFTAYISQKRKGQAWWVALSSLNIALLFFLFISVFIFIFSRQLYQIIAPGFEENQLNLVANLTKILLLAQAFFILSYFLTGVLESLQRFLVPALSPLFYNLGIILGAVFLSEKLGIYAPAIGAVFGAFLHFLVQLPLAIHFGLRPKIVLDISHPGVREIGRLALPRIVEFSFLQLDRIGELFLASLVATAAYTYYTFANSLQLLPIGLFGVSLAKACLPTLSSQATQRDLKQFKETFSSLFNQIVFLVFPCSIFLIVLRVPVVRLAFGTARFSWESTLQTGFTLSAFSLSILAQALIYLLSRSFWALHETKTPVKISILAIFIHIFLGGIFIIGLKLPIWSLALAFSLATILQASLLFLFLQLRLKDFKVQTVVYPFLKIAFASLVSGGFMFFFLKILDRSVWAKRLSFLGRLGLALPTNFDRFIFDTRYTLNVILLTSLVALIGFVTYFILAWLLKINELAILTKFLVKFKKPELPKQKAFKEKEPYTPAPE